MESSELRGWEVEQGMRRSEIELGASQCSALIINKIIL